MSVSTLFIGFAVVSCILICLATLGIVVGLVDFYYVLSILRVLLILSRLFRATISVFFVPCCPVLLLFYLVLSYMLERNKWRWRCNAIPEAAREDFLNTGIDCIIITKRNET